MSVFVSQFFAKKVNEMDSSKSDMKSKLRPSTTSTKATRTKDKNTPTLQQLISQDGQHVIGDVSHLLDWAVLGFPKCGTTTLLGYLDTETSHGLQHERCELAHHGEDAVVDVVKSLYEELPQENNMKHGLKCPGGISTRYLHRMTEFFYKTKIIIGLRHPVLWFQSYYNYRIEHKYDMPPPQDLLKSQVNGVSVARSRFHENLAYLGKTPLISKEERSLLSLNDEDDVKRFRQKVSQTPHKLFVYEIGQVADVNVTRSDIFRNDLGEFVGIRDLGQMIHKNAAEDRDPELKAKEIDICDDTHAGVRRELMVNAKDASRWIRTFFLDSDDVHYSSRDFLEQALAKWEVDPCVSRR